MTLQEMIAQRDALLKARASGVQATSFGEVRVEYRSDVDLRRQLGDLERRIAEMQAGARPTTIRFATSKGL